MEQEELLSSLEELERRKLFNQLLYLYPDEGPLARHKYAKHLEFFNLGKEYNERALLGGNRSGKSTAGCYEDVLHATGLYPSWWTGHRFDCPTVGWACGDTGKTIRDVLQEKFLGPIGNEDLYGSGLIPKHLIIRDTKRLGAADAVETIYVRHVSGGISSIQLKAYEQGRVAYQGAACHWIHPDEEPPMDIYVECLLRLTTTKGIIYITATPLLGLTDVMLAFLPHMAPASDDVLKESVKTKYN